MSFSKKSELRNQSNDSINSLAVKKPIKTGEIHLKSIKAHKLQIRKKIINIEDKGKNFLRTLSKILGLLACLYFFVVSLNLMSISFPLIGGRYASEAFRRFKTFLLST